MLSYGAAGMLCASLSQAGTTVQGAYDLLVSMSIITYFIPFVFLFLAMIRLQRQPFPRAAMRLPGGRPVAILLASLGLVTTVLTIILSVIPSAEEPHKGAAVAKMIGSTLVLLGAGIAVY